MALPKLNALPEFELKVPSTGKMVKFRPFLVKEQKILLMALETQDQRQIYNAMQRIVNDCFEDVNTNVLTTYDIEYMFLNLRSKSVGETIELKMNCMTESCEHATTVSVSIDDIAVPMPESSTSTIEVGSGITIELGHPPVSRVTDNVKENMGGTELLLQMMKSVIVAVCTDDERIVFAEEADAEQNEFIESLRTNQLDEIAAFAQSVPSMEYDVAWTCEGCGSNNERKLRGLTDFF